MTDPLSMPGLLALLGVLACLPGVALRLFVRIYPKDHPRRAELIADLHVRPHYERPIYVVQCLEVALGEALSERRRRNSWAKLAFADMEKELTRAEAAVGDSVQFTSVNMDATHTYRPVWKRLVLGPDISRTLRMEGTNSAGRRIVIEQFSPVGQRIYGSKRAVTRVTIERP